MAENLIDRSFLLPCGSLIKNRICKAAMTERLCEAAANPTASHLTLYKKWADTGAGLLITGNIMTDHIHLESAGNMVLNNGSDLHAFMQLTEIAKGSGNHVWAQISHSGRQTTRFVNLRPKSASDVQLKKMGLFGKPVPLNTAEIEEIIRQFVISARLAKASGFTGIQLHAAHGYLISQFLSPKTNKRKDVWGGSIENRSRLLRTVIERMRMEVGNDYPISVKLNSADFQRGGFSEEDSLTVIKMLDEEGVDLIEISGGTYERLIFFEGQNKVMPERSREREAYFLDFSKKIRQVSKIPLMVTGGFRTREKMNQALENRELDMIGLARPFINDIEQIQKLIRGEEVRLSSPVVKSPIQLLNDSAEGGYYARQIFRIAHGKSIRPKLSASYSSIWLVVLELFKAMKKKRHLNKSSKPLLN